MEDYMNDYYNELVNESLSNRSGCGTPAACGFCLMCLLVMLLTSCRSVKYVAVPEVHTDTCYVSKVQRDSIYIERHDSIVTYQKGDTVTIDRWHYLDRWRDRFIADTVYQSKTDSIYKPYPVEVVKEVPREAGWWEELFLWSGVLLWFALFIWIVWKLKRFIPWI